MASKYCSVCHKRDLYKIFKDKMERDALAKKMEEERLEAEKKAAEENMKKQKSRKTATEPKVVDAVNTELETIPVLDGEISNE